MSGRVRRFTGRAVAGAAAAAFAGTALGVGLGVARQHRVIARRGAGDAVPFGSLRSAARTVVAEDGVPLHVEVDEAGPGGEQRLTVVFVHGYALNLDCWHFQRAAYRGLVRTVFYDQRSHGRSGRSAEGRATIDQLGRDLRCVLDQVVGDGPVVLVGHSMGGMSILALAEEFPELFGDRVVGVGLIATTAGGLTPHRLFLPLPIPSEVGSDLARRLVATLGRQHRAVDGVRRLGRAVSTVVTDHYAFGDDVPPDYIAFVEEMLAATPFAVIAEFFPHFSVLDKYAALEALGSVPTTVLCGTDDKLTAVDHSRTLAASIAGSTLVECPGAGHMVIMERHDQVDAALDQLLAAAQDRTGRR